MLVVAYACHPDYGSEEGVGWGWLVALAKHHDVSLITANFNRDAVNAAIQGDESTCNSVRVYSVPHKLWHYSRHPAWVRIENSFLKPMMNLAYQSWLKDAYKLAVELNAEVRFDIAHLITYVGFRFPGKFYRLDVPFVWGPIGGLENTPWRFLPALGAQGAIYYTFRNLINSIQKLTLPGPKRAMRAAKGGIIAATEGIRQQILRWYGQESEVICEIGPPATRAIAPSVRERDKSLRLAWSGQHVANKALPLLLNSLAKLPASMKWELTVLGEGPCTSRWKSLAEHLKLQSRCCWTGRLPRDEAIRRLAEAHVFCITSLKDLTSTVLLEALAQGVPVICPDHCGFSNVIDGTCGIKIPLVRPRQFVDDYAAAIGQLADDETYRFRLAEGALERIHDFEWEKKAETVNRIYRRMLTPEQHL